MATPCTLKILSWNIQGVNSKTLKSVDSSKFKQKKVLSLFKNHNIVCINETWLKNDVTIKGFREYYSHRTDRHFKARKDSGGLCIFVKDEINHCIERLPSASDDILWLKVNKSRSKLDYDIFICCAYISPEKSSYTKRQTKNILDFIDIDVNRYKKKGKVILCGDLNSRTSTSPDFDYSSKSDTCIPLPNSFNNDLETLLPPRSNKDIVVNNFGKWLLDTCISNDLMIVNGRFPGDKLGNYTCVKTNGSSVVDYNVISKDLCQMVNTFKVLPLTEYSDHCPISLSMSIPLDEKSENNIHDTVNKMESLPARYIWGPDSNIRYTLALNEPHIQNLIQNSKTKSYSKNASGIDEIVKDTTNIYTETAKISLAFKKIKCRKKLSKPWFDYNMFYIRQNLLYVLGLLNRYPHRREIREDYYKIKSIFNKNMKIKERKFKENILNNLENLKGQNPSEYWKLFNKLKCNQSSESNEIDPVTWQKYYKSLLKENYDCPDNFKTELETLEMNAKDIKTLDTPITDREILAAIRFLKNKKSPGPDSILNEMIKFSKHHMMPLLNKMFNFILENSCFPTTWKKGYIINIFKSNNPLDPSNYRGITLSSCLGKLFSSILNCRITEFLEGHGLISKYQAGFRKDFRTSDNLFILSQLMKYYKEQDAPLYLCFIDLQKAFDKLWRPGLFAKLCNIGLGGNLYHTVKSMYLDNISAVKLDQLNKHTDFFPSEAGVRQGDSLSPTLFNIFINDMLKIFEDPICKPAHIKGLNIGCLAYADDLLICSESKEGLQEGLKRLHKYCTKWRLTINVKKSKIMLFNKAKKGDFKIGTDSLEIVRHYKYLGLTIANNGKYCKAVSDIMNKATKATFAIRSNLFAANISNIKSSLIAFNTLILPVLLYGSEIWAADIIEKEQRDLFSFKKVATDCDTLALQFYKRIMGLPLQTTNLAVLAEIGAKPMMFEIVPQIWKFLNRLNYLPDSRLVAQTFLLTKDRPYNLFAKVNNIVHENTGLNMTKETFQKKNKCKLLFSQLRDSFHDFACDKGMGEVRNITQESKLRTYKTYKSYIKTESYLNSIHNSKIRITFSRFRLSAHSLNIEKGRHRKENASKRLCKQCSMNRIEDEIHFLLHCPKYNNLRNDFIDNVVRCDTRLNDLCNRNDDTALFIALMKNRSATIIVKLANFVFHCFKIRDNLS